jgi:hypothetical protein
MAIVDLSSSSSFPVIKVITGVGTTQQEIALPQGKLQITAGAAAAIYLCTSGVSDGAAMPADKLSIPADQLLELSLSYSTGDKISSFAVAAQSGTADIQIILERA